MHIVIIGPGNLGSLYGAKLARAGAEVTLLGRAGPHLDAIAAEGLHVDGLDGAFTVHPRVTSDPAAMPAADVALVTMSGHATDEAARLAQAVLKPDGFLVTLQNGLGHVELLAAALGSERVLAGLMYHSADRTAPGRLTYTVAGTTVLGEMDGTRSERLVRLAELLERAGLGPVLTDNLLGAIWEKFLLNCAVNAPCAATGLVPQGLVRSPEVNAMQTAVINEGVALARKLGVTLPEGDPVQKIKDFCQDKVHTVSMVHHLARGERTEIDCLNVQVVVQSDRLGMQAPFNGALSAVIKGMEASGGHVTVPARAE